MNQIKATRNYISKVLIAVVFLMFFTEFFVIANQDTNDNQEDLLEDIREDSILNTIPEKDLPKFGEPLQNVTVPVGREAVLQCVVDNLQTYKIAWLRVDTQTILTIQNHVITKNHRMSITHAEKRAWILKIRDVKESDKGWYMCQINTDPMKSQVGYLDVVVPPDILDYPTSADMVVREGSNVTLKCAATGSPTPTITWRREGGIQIQLPDGQQVVSVNGSILSIARVNRSNMGAYLCIASNGIPPTVSKRVMVIVHFPPMIWIQNQLVGAAVGQTIKLECQSEAFPKSINYWMRNDTIIVPGENFVPEIYENGYKVVMKLTIKHVDMSSFGSYKCVSKNSLGDTDGAIKLYQIPHTTAMTTVAATRPLDTFTSVHKIGNHKGKNFHHKSSVDILTMSTNNVLIGATSSLWNSQDEIRDKHPDSNNRSERPSNISNTQHKANDLSNNGKSHTSSSSSSVLLPIPSSSSLFFILLFSLFSSLKLFSITLKFKEHKII